MDKQDLHKKLQQLHTEFQQLELVDEKERDILQQLMADIQELLEQEEGYQVHRYKRLGERLRESIKQFEVSHPRLTMMMGQTIDMLATMGI